jgi:4-hydroxy-tetrahydrodipicolinate reductase
MTQVIRVALVGVGATGLEIGRSLLGREGAELVAAVDTDPAKAGRTVGELLGDERADTPVRSDLGELSGDDVDIAVVTVGSTMASVAPVLERLASAGIDAISLCEELAFPWYDEPEASARLHRHAVEHGTSVLATGCNPGFLMDTLPIVVSAAMQVVERVSIVRTTDLSAYGPLLGKFGFGLDPAEHARRTSADIVGHIGFRQSIAHLAHVLGWQLDAIEVDAPEPVVVTATERSGAHLRLPAGSVAAVRHEARGVLDGEAVITCVANFGFLAPEDELRTGDRWRFEGAGRTVELESPDGFDSWATTIAVLVNVIGAVAAAPAGLLTMSDLPVGALAAKGRATAPPPAPHEAGAVRGRP